MATSSSSRASDRYLEPGARSTSNRPTARPGYAPSLKHGVTGKGLNDYDAIFRILADAGYRGWVNIEDEDGIRKRWRSRWRSCVRRSRNTFRDCR